MRSDKSKLLIGFALGIVFASIAFAVNCGVTPESNRVSITQVGDLRWVIANGCPGYDWTDQSTPNNASEKNFTFTITATPRLSVTKTYIGAYRNLSQTPESKIPSTETIRGPVGIGINGVALFGNTDANGLDAYINEGSTFDHCKGHPNDARGGSLYHYHAEPTEGCVYNETDCRHSPLFGIMMDGFPLFGVYGDYGQVPTDLDECGGHVDATYPFYHYHVAPNYQYPYLINCLSGCLNFTLYNTDFIQPPRRFPLLRPTTNCTEAPVQYDYSSLQSVIDGTYELPCTLKNGEEQCREDLEEDDDDDDDNHRGRGKGRGHDDEDDEDDDDDDFQDDFDHCRRRHNDDDDDDNGHGRGRGKGRGRGGH